MIAEIYDALLDAGAAEPKARRAAEAMSGHDDRFDRLEAKIEGVEARLDAKLDRVEAKLEKIVGGFHAKIDRVETALRGIDRVETALRGEQVLVRWMLATSVGLLLAIFVKTSLH